MTSLGFVDDVVSGVLAGILGQAEDVIGSNWKGGRLCYGMDQWVVCLGSIGRVVRGRKAEI